MSEVIIEVSCPSRAINKHNLIEVPIQYNKANCGYGVQRALPNVLISNIRSLVGKVDELYALVSVTKSQLALVAETWLNDNIPDEVVQVPGMTLIRKDRALNNGVRGRGGGVAVFVDNNIHVKHRMDISTSPFECLWVILRPQWLPRAISRIAVAVVYLPPSMSSEDLDRFYDYFYDCYDKLISESSDTFFIVACDFNPTNNGFQIKSISNMCHLNQVVKNPTRGTNMLDLIFTNCGDFFKPPEILAPIASSDHATIVWKSTLQEPKKMPRKK
jgi:hypothetical protein